MLKYSQFIFYNLNKDLKQIHMNFTLDNKNNYKLITEKLAITWTKLNFLHPFKEGNGRTQRLFLEMLAMHLI